VRTNGVENIEFVRCVLNESMNLGTWEWLLWWSGIVNDSWFWWWNLVLVWVLDSEKWDCVVLMMLWWSEKFFYGNEWLSMGWVEKTRDWGFCFCLLLGLRLMKVNYYSCCYGTVKVCLVVRWILLFFCFFVWI
jgi:hypothetical protein